MALSQHKRAVGVFSSRHDAEHALNELQSSGFDMNKVSVISRDANDQDQMGGADVRDRVGNKADEGATAGALTGGTLGGITGLLVGLGTLAIPGVGPVMLAGEIATALATTVAGGAIGAAAGGLVGGLIGLGIPEERAKVYSDRVSRGDYLILVNGSDEDIARAEAILNHRGIEDWGVYDHPGATPTTTDYAAMPTAGVGGIGTPVGLGATTPIVTPMGMGGVTGTPVDYTSTVDPAPASYATTQTTGIDRTIETDVTSQQQKRAVGVFPNRRNSENALNELRDSGYQMDRVSVVTKDADRGGNIAGVETSDRVGNKADEGATTGAVTGGALGGITGLLVGLGALAIPGIGPVMVAGATGTAIATTLSGGAIGAAAGGLIGALVGLGIPEERAKVYNDRVSQGHDLVFVDGTHNEIRSAERILHNQGIQEWGVYDAPGDDTTRTDYSTSTRQDVAAVDTTRTDYRTGAVSTDPKVIIVDNRDQTR